MVYLAISHVDPEKLRRRQSGELLRETFRIDERSSPPSESEVELCRILLPPSVEENGPAPIQLENAIDVFFPGYNNLDLRYRPQARSRSQAVVRVAQVMLHTDLASNPVDSFSNLSYLIESVEALYPAMSTADEIGQLTLQPPSKETRLSDYDLLYLKAQQSVSLSEPEMEALREYLQAGGVLLVEVSTIGKKLEELRKIKQQLQEAIARIDTIANLPASTYPDDELTDLVGIRPDLETELKAAQAALEEQINDVCLVFRNFAQQLGSPLENLENLIQKHPLRTQPFLFSALPTINEQPIQILLGGGIIVIIGELSSAWGLDEKRVLGRETIRTAQEMGINLLHFAWRRRQLTPLVQQDSLPASTPEKPGRSERLKENLFKKLIE
jgi:hypothetical protein